MIKFTKGGITNPNTGEYKDIVVKAVTPNTLRDVLIGGGLILVGTTYLAITAFKKGASAFEDAEFKALEELKLI